MSWCSTSRPPRSVAREIEESLHESSGSFATQGVAIVYISHRLEEIAEIADRMTVLRDGAVVATVDAKSTSRSSSSA